MKVLLLCLFFAGVFSAPGRRPLYYRGRSQIVGGTDAVQGEFPYQLSFQEIAYGNVYPFCAASIYDENTAITAGHCVYDGGYDNDFQYQVVAGELDFSVDSGFEQVVEVSKSYLHEDYDSLYLVNDIALLKFKTPLVFNENVASISLPEKGQDTTGTCTVIGWGRLTQGGQDSDILQKVQVPIVSDEECRKLIDEDLIADSMICAGVEGKDSCQGDSGGPMVCNGYLGGIVSWGRGCAQKGNPGVYTEVAYFIDWIKEHV